MASPPVVEGLLAIHKPTGISSAQVIRDVQQHLDPSDMFKPWLEQEQARLKDARKHMHKARFRKSRQDQHVKMGHGGTLDPMATGVLILGIGAGTKRLSDFLSCTKSYDAVLLFGQATDTYDVVGKTVARKPYDHVTREKVEEALARFRGAIMQKPPIYSALRIDGKHMYEYAREGKELPKEIQARPVTVESLEIVDWYEGGSHAYHWPQAEASDEEKKVAEKVLHLDGTETATQPTSLKRAREDEDATEDHRAKKSKEEQDDAENKQTAESNAAEEPIETAPVAPNEPDNVPCPAPACLLRMTVTSGFYVRSLCHDLGEAVDSLGTMASLVRTKQGDFELGKNVFEYDDLSKGEDVWGPKLRELIKPVS